MQPNMLRVFMDRLEMLLVQKNLKSNKKSYQMILEIQTKHTEKLV